MPPAWEILTLNEAVNRGLQPHSGNRHLVYKSILNKSTLENARRGKLYTFRHINEDLQRVSHAEVLRILRDLLRDRLIVSMLQVEVLTDSGMPVLVPYFAAISVPDRARLTECYEILLNRSVEAYAGYFKRRPWFDDGALLKDLTHDFEPESSSYIYDDRTVFSLVRRLDYENLEAGPPASQSRAFLDDLQKELTHRGFLIPLRGFGYIAAKPEEIPARYAAALDFFKNRILPKVKSSKGYRAIRRTLEAVNFEEAIYHEQNPLGPQTTRFDLRRVKEYTRFMTTKKNPRPAPAGRSPAGAYQGRLAVETILACLPVVQKQHEQAWQRQIEHTYNRIKGLLSDPSHPEEALFILNKQTRPRIPEPTITLLQNDPEVVYIEWQDSHEPLTVFALKSFEIFHRLIDLALEGKVLHKDYVLILREIVERTEAESPERLRNSTQDLNNYGRLLAKAYAEHIPWYYRIFVYLRLPFFQDRAYTIAKEKIRKEQRALAKHHAQRAVTARNQADPRFAELRKMEVRNSIMGRLDEAMLENQMRFITVAELAGQLDMDEPALIPQLKANNFVLIPVANKAVSEFLVFYPVDTDFRYHISRVLNRITLFLTEGGAENLSDKDRARMELMKNYLQRKQGPAKKEEQGDSFDEFAKEIDKLQKTEQRLNK